MIGGSRRADDRPDGVERDEAVLLRGDADRADPRRVDAGDAQRGGERRVEGVHPHGGVLLLPPRGEAVHVPVALAGAADDSAVRAVDDERLGALRPDVDPDEEPFRCQRVVPTCPREI